MLNDQTAFPMMWGSRGATSGPNHFLSKMLGAGVDGLTQQLAQHRNHEHVNDPSIRDRTRLETDIETR